jgi:hypothetical protein
VDPNLRSGGAPADLTGLSLEELYNLDVIQLNVIGGHTHPAGQKMVGYEFMFMDLDVTAMDRPRRCVTNPEKDFPAASTGMMMEEHMVELMYAPTDKLTLMAMLPVKHMEMDMRPRAIRINQRRFTEFRRNWRHGNPRVLHPDGQRDSRTSSYP